MNIKRLLLIVALIAVSLPARSQTVEDYNAIIDRFQRFYNLQYADSIYDMFSPELQARLPLDKTTEKIGDLYGKFGQMLSNRFLYQKDGVTFYGAAFTNINLSLMITFNLYTSRFESFRLSTTAGVLDTQKSNFFLRTAKGTLYGTLTQPAGMGKVPVVLIIPGFGPLDRNGNNPFGIKANTYSVLADSLQKRGYACLRYDKRGVGESAAALPNEEDLTFDDMISDATGFAKLLRQYWRFNKVIIIGHSEGSLVGMKAAAAVKANGYISLEGLSERADKKIEKQLKAQSKSLAKRAKAIFDSMRNGYTVSNTDTGLHKLFARDEQNYLRTWMMYDPKKEIKHLEMPVMILQGTTDIEIAEQEAEALKKADKSATLIIIPGMNYVLRQAPEDRRQNEATYADPALPLSPALLPAIDQFIKGL